MPLSDPAAQARPFMQEMKTRQHETEGVFWMDGRLAVLDPKTAQATNHQNFHDMMVPDSAADLLRRRASPSIAWKEVRASWTEPLQKLSEPEQILALEERMAHLLDERRGRTLELPAALQEVFTRALIPTIIAGLSEADTRCLTDDQDFKLARIARKNDRPTRMREHLRSAYLQIRTTRAVHREIKGRAAGKRPRHLDLTDPVVDLLPTLGMERARNAVTTVLTAVTGPPGSVATCMAFELVRQREWAERIAEELRAVAPEALYASPARTAPLTHRFVKETLRMWSAPMVLTRVARKPIDVCPHAKLEEGQEFLLSPYFTNHDPERWENPETFDPERWTVNGSGCPHAPGAYAPFGWSPTSCIGAGLGTLQLIALCRLLTQRFQLDVPDPEAVTIFLGALPLVEGFVGEIHSRA